MKSKQPSAAPRTWLPRSAAIATGLVAIMAPVLPVFATPASDSLVITENSSTSLTATFTDASGTTTTLTPTLNSANNWSLTLPVLVYIGGGGEGAGAYTPEPSGETGFNNVFDVPTTGTSGLFGHVITVASDVATTTGSETQAPDGTRTQVGSTFEIPVIGPLVTIPVYLTFHDAGDGGSTPTPDAGSTALLGVLSFLALFGVARLRAGSAPAR